MQRTLRQDGLIHRRSMLRPNSARCGAQAPEDGYLNLSNTGVGVTCPACNPQKPQWLIDQEREQRARWDALRAKERA